MRLASIVTVAIAALLALGGALAVRAQDTPEGEGGDKGDEVAQLLRKLVRETRGVRDAVTLASASRPSDLEANVRAIREALKPGEVAVVRLGSDGAPAPAETQERQLNDWAQKGFRLVAVSGGYAYFQK